MTKKLSDLFDLPSSEDSESVNDTETLTVEETKTALAQVDSVIDKIDEALPAVRGLDKSDEEMDELASMAVQAFRDLTDLGFNVDSRYSSEILSVAGTMLGHALTAKTAKLNKKLKMVDLQLKKYGLDKKLEKEAEKAKESDTSEDIPLGEGKVLTRNELLQRIAGTDSEEKDK